jgi:hypothetical protein
VFELVVSLISWVLHVSHPTFESSALYRVSFPQDISIATATIERSLSESGARSWSIKEIKSPKESWSIPKNQTILQRLEEFALRIWNQNQIPVYGFHGFRLAVQDSDPQRVATIAANATAKSWNQVGLADERRRKARYDELASEIASLRQAGRDAAANSMELMFAGFPERPFWYGEPSKGREIIIIREPLIQSAILAVATLATIISYLAVRRSTPQPKLIPV